MTLPTHIPCVICQSKTGLPRSVTCIDSRWCWEPKTSNQQHDRPVETCKTSGVGKERVQTTKTTADVHFFLVSPAVFVACQLKITGVIAE